MCLSQADEVRCGADQSLVDVGPEETRVGVSLHQPKHDPLGLVKTHRGGGFHIPADQISGLVVDVDLSWSLCLDVALVDLCGLAEHSEGGFNLLVVLTYKPELNVLIAEFRLQKGFKRDCTIF